MFVNAIEVANEFTRPLHSISRTFRSTEVVPGAATLFIVNKDGWALTCRHVAELIMAADQVNPRYAKFTKELAAAPAGTKSKAWRKSLEKQYGYRAGVTVQIKNNFVNCADFQRFEIRMHDKLDLALIRFDQFSTLGCSQFPRFAKDGAALKQGKSLCRLGFPFPEFSNFAYDAAADDIHWTTTGRQDTPRFPIEGMLTRHIGEAGKIVGFELSTPGLRGQSGGPAFDVSGTVWGMQARTAHLDLNFDIDQEVLRDGRKRRVQDHAFLNVGHCVHVDVLKDFMRSQGVTFQEA
ncbi:MAG: trypsin-like peptidase domain-containing protein [Bacillota bacterium]|nr:trypsin-like peptidase domain-containing protein [Bacillota bacterium]